MKNTSLNISMNNLWTIIVSNKYFQHSADSNSLSRLDFAKISFLLSFSEWQAVLKVAAVKAEVNSVTQPVINETIRRRQSKESILENYNNYKIGVTNK